MSSVISMELEKALTGRPFWVSLAIMTALALLSAWDVAQFFAVNPLVISPTQETVLSTFSAFRWWISVDGYSMASGLFYLVAPLLASAAYGCSYLAECEGGYLAQPYTRTGRASYYRAKALAVFVAGGLVVLVPQVLNLLALMCFLPAYVPAAKDFLYLSVGPEGLFSWLYYNAPGLYAVAYCLLSSALCGCWSLFVLSLSLVLRNRVTLVVGPYVVMQALAMMWDQLTIEVSAPVVSFCWLLRGSTADAMLGWLILVLEVACLALVAVVVPWKRLDGDVL